MRKADWSAPGSNQSGVDDCDSRFFFVCFEFSRSIRAESLSLFCQKASDFSSFRLYQGNDKDFDVFERKLVNTLKGQNDVETENHGIWRAKSLKHCVSASYEYDFHKIIKCSNLFRSSPKASNFTLRSRMRKLDGDWSSKPSCQIRTLFKCFDVFPRVSSTS